ncbi:MAG TPA: bifunctional riboflavin kinase/FAD synthetase, partial [Solirubrobacterales bacterium]|nr:bifunctional riboflavin kinase/FAD synthetase [Solirubrobacterales bacterium]
MKVTSLPDAEPRPRNVAIGTFDGVHLGHQAVIEGADTVLTFDPHPLEVLHPAATPKLIMPFNVKRDVIEGLGVQELVVIPFDQEFAHRSAEDFIEHVLLEKLDAKQVSVGENFRFGAKAQGDPAMLEARPEFQARVVPLVEVDGETVSSTRIRALVAAGEMEGARRCLGAPFMVEGEVVTGDQRGRELGFPTANVPTSTDGTAPADGVYAGWLRRLDTGETFPAAISVGTNPTFDGQRERRVESYVLDRTDLELYGVEVEVSFVDRLRGMVAFDSIDALLEQM